MDIEQQEYMFFLKELSKNFEFFLEETGIKYGCEKDEVFESLREKIIPLFHTEFKKMWRKQLSSQNKPVLKKEDVKLVLNIN